MRHQRFQVDQTASDEAYGFGVLQMSLEPQNFTERFKTYLVSISVLKADINLIGAQMHKRELGMS